MSAAFWSIIEAQLTELRTAITADDVLRILSKERNPLGGGESGDGFFAGSGGDETVLECLQEAGWRLRWIDAEYHWSAEAPNGDIITYVEGDIYHNDRK